MSGLWRWPGRWRLVSAAAGLWLTLAIFAGPFEVVFGPRIQPLLDWAGLGPGARSEAVAAPGFVLSVRSAPPGATLWVEGVERGTTPTVTNVACRTGQQVELQVRKPNFPVWQARVECREGRTLIVNARLR